jgi:hypothetical protein
MAGTTTTDWRSQLATEFTDCVTSINQQIVNTGVADPLWQRLHDQRQQYAAAIDALNGSLIDTLIAQAASVTSLLERATDAAVSAVDQIRTTANVVGFAAALLVLATAIASAASTGNAAGLASAAQGVVTAASKFSPCGPPTGSAVAEVPMSDAGGEGPAECEAAVATATP